MIKKKAALAREFRRGYYAACANLVAMHGEGNVAEDVLRAYGAIDFGDINDFDYNRLRAVAKEIKRKNKLARKGRF